MSWMGKAFSSQTFQAKLINWQNLLPYKKEAPFGIGDFPVLCRR